MARQLKLDVDGALAVSGIDELLLALFRAY